MMLSPGMSWHAGEIDMQRRMRVPPIPDSPSSAFLSPKAAFMLQRAPLLAIGAFDREGRPWTALWGDQQPFAQVLGQNVVGIKARVDRTFDPVVDILMAGKDESGTIRLDDGSGEGVDPTDVRRIGGLTLDLETRDRVKLAGKLMVGNISKVEDGQQDQVAEMAMVVRIEESLGNCPKYLNKWHIIRAEASPQLISDSPQLPEKAISLLAKADLFFVSSSHKQQGADTNHRGGSPGFTRVLSNDESGAVIMWPEYSGNRLYQTLGNLVISPLAGLVFPDLETGDVLYITGEAEIVTGPEAAALLPRSNLVVKIKVTRAKFVQNGLPFRGQPGDPSPYNPAIRYFPGEKVTPGAALPTKSKNAAILLGKTDLTPTIARFRFRIEDPSQGTKWKPGQYVALSFADELDVGYSHMRDDDPRSINDDYIRTFTVSNAPSKRSMEGGSPDEEFELTIRKVGNATIHLFRQNPRAGFEVPLNGFEGEFKFEEKPDGGLIPIIAAGIGITPLLGQLDYLKISQVRLLWSVAIADIGLVTDTIKRHPELGKVTTLFLTGSEEAAGDEQKEQLKGLQETPIKILRRRMEKSDVEELDSQDGVDEWYMCVGPALKKAALAWLDGKRVVYEDFDY